MSKHSFIPDSSSSSGKRKKARVDPRIPIFDETGKRVPGVRKTRTGERYECKIYHPTTFKEIWIGTFDTIPEASEAYEIKKNQLHESQKGGFICGEFKSESKVFDEKTGKRVAGVWRTTTGGRYDTRIRDPVTRKDVWVGTYDTIQQASEAYAAKEREFDQGAVQGGRRRGREIDDTVPVFDENYGERVDGVCKWKRGQRFVAKILHPVTRTDVCVGTFDTYQKASSAYQAKKKEFDDMAAKMRRSVGGLDWEEASVSDTTSSEEIQKPTEVIKTVLKLFGSSIVVENESDSENQSRNTQTTYESSNESVSSKDCFVELQKKSVYRGGGAVGFLVPAKSGGGESFTPFMDKHGSEKLDLSLHL